MKPATRAIIILSVLLALAGGWIVYSQIAGDRAMRDARTKIDSAAEANRILSESNGALKASKDAKDAENRAQALTIGKQGKQIADLKAAQVAAVNIAAAAVKEGADLKETYDAGAPIVNAIHIDALTNWYALMGLRLDPLLLTVSLLQSQVGVMGPRIVELEGSNADLLASNGRMQGMIDADDVTIAGQKVTIDGQALNLQGAHDDIAVALGRARIGEMVAVIFGITTVLEATYIILHFAGIAK